MKLSERYRWVLDNLPGVIRPALAFEIWSTLIFVVTLVPASGWLLNRIVAGSGQYAITDNDLVSFFISIRGLIFVLLTLGFVLAFLFIEYAGLLIVVVRATHGRRVSVFHVLRENLWHLPALLRLGLIQAACYLAAAVPFGIGVALTYWVLLREWDFYYYLNVQPASWWVAVAITGTLAAAYGLVAAWLYVRWLPAVPAVVFEKATSIGALRSSWSRTRGRFVELGLPLAVCWIVVIVISWVAVWLVGTVAASLLADSTSLAALVPGVLITLALVGILDLAGFVVGKTVHVMLIANACIGMIDVDPGPDEPDGPARSPLTRGRKWALGTVAVVVMLAGSVLTAQAFVLRLDINREIGITGHRGSKTTAPENTLSAIQVAIDEGADFAEIDVQTTADGVVVLIHDADLMRIASMQRRIRDITSAELADVDAGSWFDPAFSDERIPTLQEAIDLARGRIKLNIELKYNWADPDLAGTVGRMLRENDFTSECVVSSLNFPALTEIRESFPELTIGFIVFQSIGTLSRMEADFLSVSAGRVRPRLVRFAHEYGRQVHVWTVNDAGSALSMIEMGVDNIITDRPADIRRVVEEWNELPDTGKIALILRSLVVGFDGPEPEPESP